MADDRFNDAFAFRGLSIGLSQWPGASNDLWAPLITGTQDLVGRCTSTISSLNKQWLDFFQRRVQRTWLWLNTSCHAARQSQSGASTQTSYKGRRRLSEGIC